MTKAVIILQALKAKRRLKDICRDFNISYKFCHAITQGLKHPSWDIMNKFLYLIPPHYWFEEATEDFLNKIKENIKEDYSKS